MPRKSKTRYTAEEKRRYDAAYNRLVIIIQSAAPDAGEFRRALDEALAAGFPVDYNPWPAYAITLLEQASTHRSAGRAGLPQILIDAGADVNSKNRNDNTPLGAACWNYIYNGKPEYLTVISTLLAAGARPELNEKWKTEYIAGISWPAPDQQARRDWLEAYIAACNERRAERDRAQDAAPEFDYAL